MNPFSPVSCTVCGEDNAVDVYPINYISSKVVEKLKIAEPPSITLKKCLHCGHHYASHHLSCRFLSTYYGELNSEFYDNPGVWNNPLSLLNQKIVQSVEYFVSNGKILEIGCGYGHLLNSFRGDRWERHGVEPSPVAATFAQNKLSLAVKQSHFKPALYKRNYFDCILMSDVIEHLRDPKTNCADIFKILGPGGILVIMTGNIHSLTARILGRRWGYFGSYEHINFFSPKSISFLLQNSGFTALQVKGICHSGSLKRDIRLFSRSAFANFKSLAATVLKGAHPANQRRRSALLLCDHMRVVAKKEK